MSLPLVTAWLYVLSRRIPANEKGRDRLAEEELGECSVGVQRTERMLPVGTELTAVGRLEMAVDSPSDYQVWQDSLGGIAACCRLFNQSVFRSCLSCNLMLS